MSHKFDIVTHKDTETHTCIHSCCRWRTTPQARVINQCTHIHILLLP